MTLIRAFPGYLIDAEHATSVVSPAYDSVSSEERRKFVRANPDNFLNTMRLLEDFPEAQRPAVDELLKSNRANLDRLLAGGVFNEMPHPCLFIYRLDTGSHRQTGVVCELPVSEYENNRMRRHEDTLSEKEDLLAEYQRVVGVVSSPICLAYPQRDDIDRCVELITQGAANLEFESEDGVRQTIWCIEDDSTCATLARLFAKVDITYLTDGHHRAASGRRHAEIMRRENGNLGSEPYNHLLVALFPDNQLHLLPFHRCVNNTNGLNEAEIIKALAKNFNISEITDERDYRPGKPRSFGMWLQGKWYRLSLRSPDAVADDPVASLDVSILQEQILSPIFGITDHRNNNRLNYVSDIGGLDTIKRRAKEGWDVFFVCHAASIDQLMTVADAGGLMPPKSTYFDPKPRSGIFLRKL